MSWYEFIGLAVLILWWHVAAWLVRGIILAAIIRAGQQFVKGGGIGGEKSTVGVHTQKRAV